MSNNKYTKILKFIVVVLIAAVVFGAALMYLWNWLVPDIFGGPELSLLQAIGLLVLSKILFGGFGNKFSHKKREMWKSHYESKYSKMDPEEREKFKQSLKSCFTEKSQQAENQQ